MTKKQLKVVIGRNIRRERLTRSLSIEKLAEHLDLSPGYMSLIELGSRGATAYNLYKLSEFFDIGVDRLYLDYQYKHLSASENIPSKNKREHLRDLTAKLTEKELDFLIHITKLLYNLKLADDE